MAFGGFDDDDALREAGRRWLTLGWRDNDTARLRALAAPDYRYDLVGRDAEVGLDWYLGFLKTTHQAVEGLDVEFRDLLVDGDDVAVHMLIRGRQTGKLFGIDSRGASGAIDVMTRLEFRDGKVLRQSTIVDFAALQAGLRR
ncbi:MAG: ester cyclase [Pseudomonadales bacterium]|jgi:predicted ester cyclase|nr:ester cyclase [Pseudomonadales bacterium]